MGSLKDVPIVIELVLIGFQVVMWASLLMFAIFGFNWVHLDALKDWSSQLSVALIGVAYMFGVIFDKAVSALPYSWIVADTALTSLEELPSPRAMRMEVLIKNPNASEALERRINQHRLVRSTVFNLALISLSALTFFLIRLGFSIRLFVSFLLLSLLFVSLSLFTGKRSAQMICFDLHHAFQAVKAASDTGLKEADESRVKLKEENHVGVCEPR